MYISLIMSLIPEEETEVQEEKALYKVTGCQGWETCVRDPKDGA